MPKCCGGTSPCGCIITSGGGVSVEGAGTPSAPYVITGLGSGGQDLGNRSGPVALSTLTGLYTMNLAGAVTLSGTGPFGEILVKITGDNTVNLTGIDWATDPLDAPGTMMIVHWPTGEWLAYALLLTGPDDGDGGGDDDGEWTDFLVDAFTGANGTLAGHVPGTTPDSSAWATLFAGDAASIESNKLAHPDASYNPIMGVDIPDVARDGMSVQIDYDLNEMGDGSDPAITLGMSVTSSNEDVSVKLTWVSGDTVTISAANGNGHGAISLTGTATGHSPTGTIRMRYDETTKAIVIAKDGTDILTGTAFNVARQFDQVRISQEMCKDSFFDNFKVAALA